MAYSLDFTIREQLAKYLAGMTSLHDFEDWFFPETWDVDQTNDFNLLNLVYSIKLRLAEFSSNDWNEAELRSLLLSILEKHVIGSSQSQTQFGTSSRSSHVTASFSLSDRSSDIKLLEVFG